MYEYIETMCPNTLMEVRTLRNSNRYNVFNYISESGEHISLTNDYDNDAINGVYHEIDGILSYNIDVASEISSKRLRIDAAAFFPEFTNNNMRGRAYEEKFRYIFPPGYVDRLKMSEGTEFYYLSNDERLADFQGDEVWLIGLYDFTLTTPSIPAGTYEVRMGYQPTDGRGAAQLYWDGIPCGIPLDLRLLADNPKVGYVTPGSDSNDPEGFENDKMMRNRGYMKGPSSFRSNGEWYADSKVNARRSRSVLRKILGIYSFDKAGTHEFKVKAARKGQFMLDYLEFVPVEYIEREGVD